MKNLIVESTSFSRRCLEDASLIKRFRAKKFDYSLTFSKMNKLSPAKNKPGERIVSQAKR